MAHVDRRQTIDPGHLKSMKGHCCQSAESKGLQLSKRGDVRGQRGRGFIPLTPALHYEMQASAGGIYGELTPN
jgi:hypothetical protein